MSKREPTYKQKSEAPDLYWLRKSLFRKFDSSLLGLADILENNETFDGLAAILILRTLPAFAIREILIWLFLNFSTNF